MRCPFCGHAESQVKDSRPSEDNAVIRRRRACPDCGGRFTTFERVQLRELVIVKRSGKRTPFDREKLARSVEIALRKRPVDPERVERTVSAIVRQLESRGETDIPSHVVGEAIMAALKSLDEVAYVRYASVYRDFRETSDFAPIPGRGGALRRRRGPVVSGPGAQGARPRLPGPLGRPAGRGAGALPDGGGRRGVEAVVREFTDHRFGGDLEGHVLAEADEPLFAEIVRGVVAEQATVDRAVALRLAKSWKLSRLDATARAILRAGAWELMRRPDIPTEVVIDEYVELARAFFEDAAEPGFINAALDAVSRDVRA